MDRTNPSTAIIIEHTVIWTRMPFCECGISDALCRGLDLLPKLQLQEMQKLQTPQLKQIKSLNWIADALIVADKTSSLPMRGKKRSSILIPRLPIDRNMYCYMRRLLDHSLRVRQLLSIQTSKLHILLDNYEDFTNKLDKISSYFSRKFC